MFFIVPVSGNNQLTRKAFGSAESAEQYLNEMVLPAFASRYAIVSEKLFKDTDGDPLQLLKEGLEAGDLKGILSPHISLDEYVPADIKSNNIVIALTVRGNPKAVYPLYAYVKAFPFFTNVGYSESSKYANTYLIYAEAHRETFDPDEFDYLIELVSKLADLDKSDVVISVPNKKDPFSYSKKKVKEYVDASLEEPHVDASKDALKKFVKALSSSSHKKDESGDE